MIFAFPSAILGSGFIEETQKKMHDIMCYYIHKVRFLVYYKVMYHGSDYVKLTIFKRLN